VTNAVYPKALEGLISGLIDLDTAVIKTALVRGYTYSASHTFMSDVTGAGGTINASSAALASVTVTSGVFDAADTTITTTASATNHVLVIYQASAVTGGADVAASAQRVIAYYDTGTGLPIQPGTGDVAVTFDNGTNKIIKFG
jgi:hypothetical protein